MRTTAPRGFTLIEIMAGLAIAAVLTVIAVPAFTSYVRYARAGEAVTMLDQIKKGSAMYYGSPRLGRQGRPHCAFPTSVKPTPPGKQACCSNNKGKKGQKGDNGKHTGFPISNHWGYDEKTGEGLPPTDADGDDRCDPHPAFWRENTWRDLHFAMSSPHFFQYEYWSQGSKTKAEFRAMAYADLDCDGILSTFQLVGKGDPRATDEECDQLGHLAIYTENETE